jgi:soluble lytic murein transglycosylase-like protein
MYRVVIFVLLAAVALAGEHAVFSSGAIMRIDRHEIEGGRVRLFQGTGSIEVPREAIASFEPDPDRVPPAAPPAPASPPSPPPAPPLDYRRLVDQAAERYGLPKELVRSVVKAESGFAPGAVSPKGAVGLMQVMPATARMFGADPHDPVQNVDAGTRYLRDLLVTYSGALWHALAAYNAGPQAVTRHGGIPPYPETLEYIRRVDHAWRAAEAR